MRPRRFDSSLECSEGTRPTKPISCVGLAKRFSSPSSAAITTALTRRMPRSACSALTNGASDHSSTSSSIDLVSDPTRRRVFDRLEVIDEHAVLRLVLEALRSYPVQVHPRPRRLARISSAVAQQKLAQLVSRDALGTFGGVTSALQIAHRFRRRLRHVHWRQVTGSKKPRQFDGIASIRLDPFAAVPRHQRWCDDDAVDAVVSQLPLQPEARRSCLVAALDATELSQLLEQRANIVRNRAQARRLAPPVGDSDRDRLLVDIQTDET
jgi:hypothetical protein